MLSPYHLRVSSGTVGKYNAPTGAAINANFITGLNGPYGLAVAPATPIPTPTPTPTPNYWQFAGVPIVFCNVDGLVAKSRVGVAPGRDRFFDFNRRRKRSFCIAGTAHFDQLWAQECGKVLEDYGQRVRYLDCCSTRRAIRLLFW